MNIAPSFTGQVNIVGSLLAELERHPSAAGFDRFNIAYNAFADVEGYQLPHIDHFDDRAAVQAGLERVMERVKEMIAEQYGPSTDTVYDTEAEALHDLLIKALVKTDNVELTDLIAVLRVIDKYKVVDLNVWPLAEALDAEAKRRGLFK